MTTKSDDSYLKLASKYLQLPSDQYINFLIHLPISLHIFLNSLSLQCINTLFEVSPSNNITKKKAYDSYKIWFKHHYIKYIQNDSNLQKQLTFLVDGHKSHAVKELHHHHDQLKVVNTAVFGKLIKFAFEGLVESKRIGPRVSSKYCYTNLRLKPSIQGEIDSINSKIKRISFIDSDIRFDPLKRYTASILDDFFRDFILNDSDKLDYLNACIEHHQMENLSFITDEETTLKFEMIKKTLMKSDLLLNNFIIQTMNNIEMFNSMIHDWYSLDLLGIITESLDRIDEDRRSKLVDLVQKFPSILQAYTDINDSHRNRMLEDANDIPFIEEPILIYKFFKFHLISTDDIAKRALANDFGNNQIIQLKLNLTGFFLDILRIFGRFPFNKILLNFKFISTTILRHLTLSQKSSFSSYWILSCFMDEYFTFLLEYYSHKKSLLFDSEKRS